MKSSLSRALLAGFVGVLAVGAAQAAFAADADSAASNGPVALASEAPADPEPADPAPVDPAPVDPAPVDPEPVDPAPVDPAPVDPAPEVSVAPVGEDTNAGVGVGSGVDAGVSGVGNAPSRSWRPSGSAASRGRLAATGAETGVLIAGAGVLAGVGGGILRTVRRH